MTLLMALTFLVTGILCINRPERIVAWIADMLKRSGNPNEPPWMKGRGVLLFIRFIGFLALINAAMLFYLFKNTQENAIPPLGM